MHLMLGESSLSSLVPGGACRHLSVPVMAIILHTGSLSFSRFYVFLGITLQILSRRHCLYPKQHVDAGHVLHDSCFQLTCYYLKGVFEKGGAPKYCSVRDSLPREFDLLQRFSVIALAR